MLKKGLIGVLVLGIMMNTCGCGRASNAIFNDNSINNASVKNTDGFVNTDALRVREEPTADAEVVALLQKEQKVNIMAEQNGFYQISIQTQEAGEILEGYVKKEYIDAD